MNLIKHTNEIVFVLAPHTDDGELGCGGTLAKLSASGNNIYYVCFSSCKQSLPKKASEDTLIQECKTAIKKLGISEDHFLLYGFDVRHFPQSRQQILEILVALNKTYQPNTVLLPARNDIHQDHQTIFEEGMRAFKYCNILGYELPWNNKAFQPNFFHQLNENLLMKKCEALRCYYSQQHRAYMNESFIRSLAQVRGIQANTLYAEAFEAYHLLV